MVLIKVNFCYNSEKYETNFIILFRLLLDTSAYGARPVLVSRASRSAHAEKSCLPARPRLPARVRALGA